jgi:hypothetical protein
MLKPGDNKQLPLAHNARKKDFLVDNNFAKEKESIINHILQIPGHIMQHHHLCNLPALVLCHLASQEGFGLEKVAYLVDNPDFDCTHGITGVCQSQQKPNENLWSAPEKNINRIIEEKFHNQVKGIQISSLSNKNNCRESYIEKIANQLEIKNPTAISWQMKHNNNGLLLFQVDKTHQLASWKKFLLERTASFLGMCGL